jgi:hypothetical protein
MFVLGGFVVVYVRKRRRTKAILARWEREEAIEDARIAARLAAERAEATATSFVGATTMASAASHSFMVERDGRWHTIH